MCVVCGNFMTSQSKNVSSKGGQRRRPSGIANVDLSINTVAVTGTANGGQDTIKPTKNTRRRIHQKRTQNMNRPKQNEEKNKPVLESTNPFFIAVCAPDTYKPLTIGGYGSGDAGGVGDDARSIYKNGNNRRDVTSSSQRRIPNVFLRSNSRNSLSNASNSMVTVNPFIHHPVIQNDRQRGGETSTGSHNGKGDGKGDGNHCSHVLCGTNIHDNEQFPSLGTSTIGNIVHTKLNFKEMILKNSSGTCGSTTVTPPNQPKIKSEYAQQQRKTLSSGNIFLGAFYPSKDDSQQDWDNNFDESGGGDGSGGDGSGGANCSFISSILIDSCDRKYDKLYQ